MASFVLLAVCFGLFVYKAYKYMFFKPPNFPPGPPRIPFFGSYLFILMINYKHFQLAIDWLCKYYKTNILGLYLGPFLLAVANDAASAKEVMLNTKLDGRPDILLSKLRDPNFVSRGTFFTQGLYWRDERRFTLRHLRDFGFGRRFTEVELDLEDEMGQLIEMIKCGPKYPHEEELFHDGMISCPNIFNSLSLNSYLKILCNKRYPRKDQGISLRAATYSYDFLRYGDSYGRLFSIVPWVAKIFPDLSEYNKCRKAASDQYDFMKMLIDEEYRTYDAHHERHFLDVYFKEMKATEPRKHFRNADFNYDQLIVSCVDFMQAVVVTLPTALSFYLRQMILKPHIKRKVQEEIDRVVGRSRLPTLDDRKEMHYTEASIREILRYDTLIPNGVPRLAMESTKLAQYDIPANCVIETGMRSAHLDSTHWNDPNNFKPERFLDEEGKLDLKKDSSIPFGGGKRLCAGETHARNTLFLLTASILQNFDISVPDESKLPRDSDIITGFAAFIPNFWVKLEAR